MAQKQSDDKVIQTYQQEADKIITNMYTILARAQRKVDDKAYRDALEKVK